MEKIIMQYIQNIFYKYVKYKQIHIKMTGSEKNKIIRKCVCWKHLL